MSHFFSVISSIFISFFLFLSGQGAFWDAQKNFNVASTTEQVRTYQPATEKVQPKTPKISEVKAPAVLPKNTVPIIAPIQLSVPPKNIPPPPLAVPLPVKTATNTEEPLTYSVTGKTNASTLSGSGVVSWTNTYRNQNNLKSLTRNSTLDAAAILKVHDMFDKQYFEHVSPTGKSPADLITSVGYEYLWEGENLALGIFSDEKDLVDAWMASPGHRANILNSHFEEIGVGVDEGTYEGKHVWIAVQEFGKPSSSCPAPEASLKTEIEQDRLKIDGLSAQASALVSEINALSSGNDVSTYNQKVSEYNALVAELNPLVQKVKSLIEVYNKEINEYNACIGAP